MPDPTPPNPQARPDWRTRLEQIDQIMLEMSQNTDPHAMVRAYGARARELYRNDGFVSFSRRNTVWPEFRITRSSMWKEQPDPWKQPHLLPVITGGLLGELLERGKPYLINELSVSPDDPAREFLDGMGSLLAIPHYENGVAVNMVAVLKKDRNGFDPDQVPDQVMVSSLFGRATGNLVLSRQLGESNAALDREMKSVADIQRSLLPTELPRVPGLDIAAHYQTSKNAGGDYYDFFTLNDGKLGLLIADVSGHGTPAAVLMAILHAIAHLNPNAHEPPAKVMEWVNEQLVQRYTRDGSMFVTAFYGIYDPSTRMLSYSSAGHNHPRLRVGFRGENGPVLSLAGAQSLPLGIMAGVRFESAQVELEPGDALVLYTDGITEAFSPGGEMFGEDRLDAVLSKPHPSATALLQDTLRAVDEFTQRAMPTDDRTVITLVATD